ncbi:MAG: antibiotic biosynthesis monooxygenase [Planctomycetes bacterium]|nr:antibiotic biosynthesis monooxygenase [Planctomycetota bacterium]
MIIVAAKCKAKPGKRDAFIQAAQPCIEATRKEEGCLFYTLYASTENDVDLLYFERWTSREALKAHGASAHMRAFAEAKKAGDIEDGPAVVEVYDVAE